MFFNMFRVFPQNRLLIVTKNKKTEKYFSWSGFHEFAARKIFIALN
jgi:hypothetical protein